MLELAPDVELVYKDETGSTGEVMLHLRPGSTFDAALSATNAVRAAFASLTGCVLVKIRIIFRVRNDAPDSPVDGVTFKRRAVFFGDTSGDNPPALVEVPGILDSVFLTTGPTAGYGVDFTNTDVSTFLALIITENGRNPMNDAITSFTVGYLQSRV